MSRMPSQKPGVARPAMAITRTTRSVTAVLLQRRDRAERDRDRDRDDGCQDRDLQRDRKAGGDLVGNRLARPHRRAEVEAAQTPDEIEELQEYRPVEPEFGMAGGDRALVEGAAAGAEPYDADVARNEAHQQKDQCRRPEQGRHHQQYPLNNISVHGLRRAPLISLFVEPDRRQILVQVMARADLPAFDIGPVGHDPIPPQQEASCTWSSRTCFSKVRIRARCLVGSVSRSILS